jgi:hypothetical protein
VTLSVPVYVREASIVDDVLRYPWDEWNIRSHWDIVENPLYDRLDALSNRSVTALALATGEWVCHRYSALCSDPRPQQFLEAAWAGNIHPGYCEYTETTTDEWRGVIRGPLNIVILIANDALFCLHDDPHAATRACWMLALARHVLPQNAAFEPWFEACVARLEQFYPKDAITREGLFEPFESMGEPVPPEAFVPHVPWDPTLAPSLLDAFLQRLEPTQNPFLRPADELVGVDGIVQPYRYIVERENTP